ncbi:MAG TPA: amidohydrolase family protein [Gaiellales bacterium]|nr:amidohydrolase family protein [Gaiellales bacterium]
MSAGRRIAIVAGEVVSPEGATAADVLIEDGLISQVGEVERSGAEVIDATGCLVLPGAIDVHTHVFGGVRDDTRSALLGGTTTALAFVDALEGERPVEAARRTLAGELPDSLVDLAFHAVIWEPLAYRSGDMRDVAEMGIGSVKLWLSYIELGIMADDDVALAVMQEAAALGMVVLAHCENGRAIDLLTRQLVAQGRLGLDSLPRSRPIALEAECVHRFLALAEVAGATPYVVHVTGARPFAEIAAARRRGMTVYGEVCPHHLRFERACHEGPDALRYVMTPPLRTAGDRTALLRGLRDGALDTYASDHCHLRLDRDKLPVAGDFTKVPTGLPGIGARLPLGFAAAVDGEAPLSPERLVEVACAAPARIFGLYPQKGTIAPGSDADIVVWDPSRPSRLTLASLGDGLDWSPYEGIEVPGSIRCVLARGDRVVEDGRFTGDEHRGAYLPVGRVSAPAQ